MQILGKWSVCFCAPIEDAGLVLIAKERIIKMKCFFVIVAVLTAGLLLPDVAESCNIGVANGTVTQDGRPLLWKVRMTSNPSNTVFYISGPQYNYIGIADVAPAWMGLNEAGLCVGNSYVSGGGSSRNREILNHILGNFGTVDEVRNYIFNVPGSTLNVVGCYPDRFRVTLGQDHRSG
jgi:hypothetical protein